LRRTAGERRTTDQHLVEDAPQRIDIGARVQLALATRLLRAHVGRGSEHQPGLGQVDRATRGLVIRWKRLRDAEVGDQRVPLGEQYVFRLDVAMEHAVGVSAGERAGYLADQPQRFRHR